MNNVREVIDVLLSLDDQVVHPRPSHWLRAAQLVHALACHAEGSLREDVFGGDWHDVDVSDERKRARI